MASTSTAAAFHRTYTSSRGRVESLLVLPNPPAGEVAAALAELRRELRAVLPGLPGYDQRRYELLTNQELSELERRLASLRAKERPRSKFAFTRQPVAAASTSLTAASSPANVLSAGATTAADAGPAAGATTAANAGPLAEDTAASPSISATATASPAHVDPQAATTSVHIAPDPTRSLIFHHQTAQYLAPPLHPLVSSDSDNPLTLTTATIEDLRDCVVDLRSAPLTALHADRLERCVLVAHWVEGSVMLSRMQGCLVVLAARQVRIHTSSGSDLLLYVPSLPIIEHSTDLVFGPYPAPLVALLDPPIQSLDSKYAQVQDFDWVRAGPSPNWTCLHDGSTRVSDDDIDLLKQRPASGEQIRQILQRLLPARRTRAPVVELRIASQHV